MSARRGPKPVTKPVHAAGENTPRNSEETRMHDQWEQETDRTLDESALRRKPDWLEAIGDEDEGERIEDNLEEQWSLRGEDDFVSNPTGESDMPNWVDDDYDDEAPHKK